MPIFKRIGHAVDQSADALADLATVLRTNIATLNELSRMGLQMAQQARMESEIEHVDNLNKLAAKFEKKGLKLTYKYALNNGWTYKIEPLDPQADNSIMDDEAQRVG